MQENVESTPEKVTAEQEAALVIEKQAADDDVLDPRIQRAVERVASNVSYAAVRSDRTQNRKVAERLVWGALIASTILALTGHDGVAATIAVSTVGAVITGFLRKKSAESGSDKDGSE